MPIYQSRMSYLLELDFPGTVRMWEENPEQLDQDIKKYLIRSIQHVKELKVKGVPMNERLKCVQKMLPTTDVSKKKDMDEKQYVKIMQWAFERECKFMEEQRRCKT